jgi:hypothetical protein
MSYDSSCYDLAKDFLDDDTELSHIGNVEMLKLYDDLAQRIQTTIEDALGEFESTYKQEENKDNG